MNKDRPKLQLALDMSRLDIALDIVAKTYEHIDILEVGTLLAIEEGLNAVRTLRSIYPSHTILADIRIIKAGGMLAKHAGNAGADWVSVVSDASLETIKAVVHEAEKVNGDMQIELSANWTWSQVKIWKQFGVSQLVYHRLSEISSNDAKDWTPDAIQTVEKLCRQGFKVTVTGGITLNNLSALKGIPVFAVIAGRSICAASDPKMMASQFQDAVKTQLFI